MAITHLFPVENKKAREAARLEINSTSLALTQLLNLLWPSEDIRLLMVNDPDISAAVVNSDLIAWNTAFQSFCLSGSGNKEINIEIAEKKIEGLRMVSGETEAYIKAFKACAENLMLC